MFLLPVSHKVWKGSVILWFHLQLNLVLILKSPAKKINKKCCLLKSSAAYIYKHY